MRSSKVLKSIFGTLQVIAKILPKVSEKNQPNETTTGKKSDWNWTEEEGKDFNATKKDNRNTMHITFCERPR